MREPLKEQNDIVSKKATTPSRIRSLFMGNSSRSTLRDEVNILMNFTYTSCIY